MSKNRGIEFAWLGDPSTVVALIILVVNDHVLKAAFPGLITGKLSDAAGLVLAPPLLAVLATLAAPRLPARWSGPGSILTVAITFGLIKIFPYGGELASRALSLVTPSLVRADPSDLLTLPALAVAWWSLRRAHRAPIRLATRPFRALRVAVLLPLALVGVAATSAVPVEFAQRVVVDGDAIYLGSGWRGPTSWAVSRDDGRTWAELPVSADAQKYLRQELRTEACAGDVCYRVVPDALAVETRTGGGDWVTSWRIGDRDRHYLYRTIDNLERIGDLSSTAIAVRETAGGGHVVLVANGPDGFAMRDATGAWQRIGFPGQGRAAPPIPDRPALPDDPWLGAVLAVFVTGLALVVGSVLATRTVAPRGSWSPVVPLALAGPPMLLWFLSARADPEAYFPLSGLAFLVVPMLGVVAGVTVKIALTTAHHRVERPAPWSARIAGITAAAAAAYLLIYVIWQRTGDGRGVFLLIGDLLVFPPLLYAVIRATKWAGLRRPQMTGSSPIGTVGRWPSKSTAE